MNQELPTLVDASHRHTLYSAGNFAPGDGREFAATGVAGGFATGAAANLAALGTRRFAEANHAKTPDPQPKEAVMATTPRRFVQVLIADSNENIPLADCLLYKGEEHLTDATDQELFYELDIRALLEAHNAKRTKIVDKKVKDRTEYLEPAKVRDLKMVVVTVANL